MGLAHLLRDLIVRPVKMCNTVLSTELVSKSFGGLAAVDNITLQFQKGCVHAIIGPNGAGKTTFINLLSGEQAATSGKIIFQGQDITYLPAHKVSQLGIGRSYQQTNIFPNFSCWKNIWLAAQSRQKSSMRFFKPASNYIEVSRSAKRALDLSGLAKFSEIPASEMSYGQQRQLEIAMLLAMQPRVLLLDEPIAGMSSSESIIVIELIKRLARDHCIVLIAHDMDAVFAVADILTVMNNGRILATGLPHEIKNNSEVVNAYLGEEGMEPISG